MTMTMPPNLPGSRRVVPLFPTDVQLDHLRALLKQSDAWVLRPRWQRYLDGGEDRHLTPIASLSRDQRIAARAWLRQQRHRLYEALEGGRMAPDDWLEALELYQALEV